jgi:hypothetical protein
MNHVKLMRKIENRIEKYASKVTSSCGHQELLDEAFAYEDKMLEWIEQQICECEHEAVKKYIDESSVG